MCMVDYGDYEIAEFHFAKLVTARRPHKCGECGRTISTGEQYERVTAKWHGEISTHRTCAHCQEARQWLQHECGGFVYGLVKEDLEEHVSECERIAAQPRLVTDIPPDRTLLRWVVGMRRQWQRFDGTGLMGAAQ